MNHHGRDVRHQHAQNSPRRPHPPGVVNSENQLLVLNNWTDTLPAGHLSRSGGTDNIIGYAGYVFNAEHATGQTPGLYTVRHRHYEPGGGLGDAAGGLGRWLSRDPIGYVDGMNLYEYVRGRPHILNDRFGLVSCDTDETSYCGPEMGESFHDQMQQNCVGLNHWIDPGEWSIGEWLANVWDEGEWDYKRHDFSTACTIEDEECCQSQEVTCPSGICGFTVQMCGQCLRKDVLGNINYGYTGRCIGISERILRSGGHVADHIFGGAGEDACDQAGIRAGYWLRGGLFSAMFSGKRDICDAITLFGLDVLCGRDDCEACPCD